MKHKRFNEILPYTYFIKNIKTNKKYYGVRYGNIKLKLTPLDENYFDIAKKRIEDTVVDKGLFDDLNGSDNGEVEIPFVGGE